MKYKMKILPQNNEIIQGKDETQNEKPAINQ